jgi:hypothetical protein
MKDTLSLLLCLSDDGDGKAALREVKEIRTELKQIGKMARTALNVAIKERDKRLGVTHV